MVLLKNPVKITEILGYFILIGIFVGIVSGVYALFNPQLFSIIINISEHEITLFFLGVYLPSFIVIVTVGYIFATTSQLEGLNLWRIGILCTLNLLCLTLSALSIFNFISFLGSFLTLVAVVFVYTKPTFKALWKREACFFVEIGTMLLASASMLLMIMWSISGLLQTYSSGIYEMSQGFPFILLVVAILSLLTFYLTPFLALKGANVELSGTLGIAVSILSFVTIVQNQHVYLNLSEFIGLFLAVAGTILTLCGALVYIKLAISKTVLSPALEPSFLYRGKYCPYCGEPWVNFNKNVCLKCGRNLEWKSRTSFCPHCGRIASQNAKNCIHCGENIESLPVYVSLTRRKEEIVLFKKLKLGRLQKVFSFFGDIFDRLGIGLKEFIYICILTSLFSFLAFIGYIRTDNTETNRAVSRYGFPLEWLVLYLRLRSGNRLRLESLSIIWGALIVDFVLYFLLALFLVSLIRRKVPQHES